MTLKIKDPGSALTHFIAMILALGASSPLIIKAARTPGYTHVLPLAIFITSMILLYAASTIYHTLDISPKVNQILRKVDHMMIFILIAGTYTPVCVLVLGDKTGWSLLALVWGIAIAGMIINALWITCPKWVSSLIYIAMGWVCVLAFGKITAALPKSAFIWLLTGGIIYTAGGIIYALKLPIFNARFKYFGSHEIFHLFVMGGSLCHYIMMYAFVAPAVLLRKTAGILSVSASLPCSAASPPIPSAWPAALYQKPPSKPELPDGGFLYISLLFPHCGPPPALPDDSSIRSKAFRPNTPEDMCSSSAVLSFSGSGTQALPARAPQHDLPMLRVPSFYILCKRQWDHGIHYRPPKASACGIYMKASGCPVLL